MDSDGEKDRKERCERKKAIEEAPVGIECECTESEEAGDSCSCEIVTEPEVREKDECESPWTGYERGKGKKRD